MARDQLCLTALTLLTVSLCGRHYSGCRCWGRNSCRGNHRPDAGTRRGLATRGGARLIARRWCTCGRPDVGSGRLWQAGANGEAVRSCYYYYVFCKQCVAFVLSLVWLCRSFQSRNQITSTVCKLDFFKALPIKHFLHSLWCLSMHVYVFTNYLPLSWAGLFKEICRWSADLAWSPTFCKYMTETSVSTECW